MTVTYNFISFFFFSILPFTCLPVRKNVFQKNVFLANEVVMNTSMAVKDASCFLCVCMSVSALRFIVVGLCVMPVLVMCHF